MKKFFAILLLSFTLCAQAQVKIGNNPNTINANSLLEMESTNKGFLPPRVALNSISSVAPLTGTVPAGMLVFSTGGTLADGYYYWNGTQWRILATTETSFVTKTANATLTKTETFVLASNDITLTLPVVTSADDGLSITVKNIGTHTDLVVVMGNGGAVIDDGALIALPRWFSLTMTANGGNWYFKERTVVAASTLEVSPYGSWQTLQEAMEFLDLHAWGPTVIKLASGTFEITETQNINLPFPLTIQGTSYGTTIIAPGTGLGGKPMFRCVSDCYFKMLEFDATALAGYGTAAGEDAIRFIGSGTYNEVKDCNFDRFYNTIVDSTNAELWVFETDINNATRNGILVHGAVPGVVLKVAETDFIGCNYGINLSKGSAATIQLASGGYYNGVSGDTAILYQPATFTSYASMSIKGNLWNNTGKFIEGFDFTRSDGRDANAIVESNAGTGDKRPYCSLTLLNNPTATSLTATSTWYKVNWDHTRASFATCKWTVADAAGGIANVNRLTYQPANRRDGYITISGNIVTPSAGAVINIGLVKNPSGTSSTSITRFGETTLYVSAGIPLQFSTVIYLSDIAPTDYFELWANSTTASISVTLSDSQWLVNTQ